MASSEGWFLAGYPDNDKFNEGLKNLVHDMILRGDYYHSVNTEFLNRLLFLIDSEKWKDRFQDIFDIRPPLPVQRVHYTCNQVNLDWEHKFPEGYRFLNLDSTLDVDSLEFPEDIREWNEFNLDDQIKKLEEKRSKFRQQRKEKRNKLMLEKLEDEGWLFDDEKDEPFAPAFIEWAKELYKNNEAFTEVTAFGRLR